MKLDDNMFAKLREATQLLQTAGPMAATEAIQRALQGVPDADAPQSAGAPQSENLHDINPMPDMASHKAAAANMLKRFRAGAKGGWRGVMQDVEDVEEVSPDPALPGQFLSRSCTNAAGTRKYKLYVPSGYKGEPLPLIVMLHGCKQNPDDFAKGTNMNALAEEHGFLVAYPGQVHSANGSNCWNWFQEKDQRRDAGEPSIIADITREIIRDYKVDSDKVYVTGLSAGGAMAVVMGTAYPDLYAAIGVHSGLPLGSAHDVPSVFAAMKSGAQAPAVIKSGKPVPVIVFHGDRDSTVNKRNGEQVIAQCLGGEGDAASTAVEKAKSPQGRSYSVARRQDANGRTIAEHWTIHGAGHAWAGGKKTGSYTDPKGPDASREMVRFFLAQGKPA